MKTVDFEVIGEPGPQGSKRAIVNPHTGKAVVIESSKKAAPWRQDVKSAAQAKFDAPEAGPVMVAITFRFTRPASHLNVRNEPKPSAPAHKITRPDIDKLLRSTLDGLKGVAYLDDAQIVTVIGTKEFGSRPGAIISIGVLA